MASEEDTEDDFTDEPIFEMSSDFLPVQSSGQNGGLPGTGDRKGCHGEGEEGESEEEAEPTDYVQVRPGREGLILANSSSFFQRATCMSIHVDVHVPAHTG